MIQKPISYLSPVQNVRDQDNSLSSWVRRHGKVIQCQFFSKFKAGCVVGPSDSLCLATECGSYGTKINFEWLHMIFDDACPTF